MTEIQFVTAAKEWGPWAAMILMLVYIVANRLGPQWLVSWSEERKAAREASEAERRARIAGEKSERETIVKLYERLIDQSDHQSARDNEMIKFVANAAEAIHEFTRSMDANTQQLYRLTQAVYEIQRQGASNARP